MRLLTFWKIIVYHSAIVEFAEIGGGVGTDVEDQLPHGGDFSSATLTLAGAAGAVKCRRLALWKSP